jgi:hypothetical protein
LSSHHTQKGGPCLRKIENSTRLYMTICPCSSSHRF